MSCSYLQVRTLFSGHSGHSPPYSNHANHLSFPIFRCFFCRGSCHHQGIAWPTALARWRRANRAVRCWWCNRKRSFGGNGDGWKPQPGAQSEVRFFWQSQKDRKGGLWWTPIKRTSSTLLSLSVWGCHSSMPWPRQVPQTMPLQRSSTPVAPKASPLGAANQRRVVGSGEQNTGEELIL